MINYSIFPHLKEKSLSVGELYNPFIKYAMEDSPTGLVYMDSVIEYIMTNFDEKLSLQKATTIVKHNVDYWCQYFSKEEEQTTKKFYSLGLGFRDLSGVKHTKELTPLEAFKAGKKIGEHLSKTKNISNIFNK